jgi:very-short-patch-repair endonuclease
MPAFTPALADHLSAHHGIIADDQLRAVGITVAQRERLVEQGVLIALHRGVYRARSTPLTLEGRCLAICLADARAVITGAAAGRLWGVRRMPTDHTIDVRVPHAAQTLSAPDVRLRRCNVLDPVDVVERADGIRLVSPPRLAFDLAETLPDLDLESVIEQILDRQWCTVRTLHETGRRLCHPARPGSSRFARVLGARPAWLKPVDSHLELRLYDALRVAGVNGIERQYELALPGGWTIHPDLAVPRLSWAIEIDHVTWHGGRIDAQRDKRNDRQARMIGWQVDRVTDDDLEHRIRAVVDELMVIHQRLWTSMRFGGRQAG